MTDYPLRCVWKYGFRSGEAIAVPKGAVLLKAGEQNGDIYLWIEVDPTEGIMDLFIFDVLGTGQEFGDDERQYIDTVQIDSYVWHVYCRTDWMAAPPMQRILRP